MNENNQAVEWVRRVSNPQYLRSASPDLRRQVRADLTHTLFETAKYGIVASAVYAVLLYLHFMDRSGAGWWLAGIIVVLSLRLAMVTAFDRHKPSAGQMEGWLRATAVLMLIQGLAWTPLILIAVRSGSAVDLVLVIYLLAAIAFGSIAGLSYYTPAFAGFVLPLVVGIWGWFGWQTMVTGLDAWAWIAITIWPITILGIIANTNRGLRGALLLAYQNRDLVADLRHQKERVQVTLHAIADGVITVDAAGRVDYLNPVAEHITGWTSAEGAGRDLDEVLALVDERDGSPVKAWYRQALEDAAPMVLDREAALVDRDGTPGLSVEVSASPIREDDGWQAWWWSCMM